MSGRLVVGAGAAAGILSLGACGSATQTATVTVTAPPSSSAAPTSGPSPSPSASVAPSGTGAVTFHVQVALVGPDSLQGTFDMAAPAHGCGAPFNLTGDIGGRHVVIGLVNPSGSGQLSPSDLTVAVDANTWVFGSAANGPSGSSGSVSVNGGAGGVAFTSLQLQSDRSRTPQENGAVQWTCR